MKSVLSQPRYSKRPKKGNQGSALLTAVIFSFVVMTLTGSYLYLSSGEYRLAARSFLLNASFNLAEGGIDLALNTIRSQTPTGWKKDTDGSGRSYWAKAYSDYDLGGNNSGEVKIVILNPLSDSPEIYAEGAAKGSNSGEIKKQIYADTTSGFFPFKNGFNSKNGIVLKGQNILFDSYDSRNGSYGLGNVNSNITISTISMDVDAIDIGNADVYGFVATGGQPPDVGPKGAITDHANPGQVDMSRSTTDYYAEFPDAVAPTLNSPKTTMPASGSIPGGDYLLSSWSSNSSDPLIITDDTTIVLTGDMKLSGNGAIEVAPGATLKIYAGEDVDLAGNGVLNASTKPQQLLVFGTNTTPGDQEINISGNGYLSAAVYAPNAVVSINGGGTNGRVFGAIAAFDAKLVGNSHFSYDEALADFNLGSADYAVEEWVELSGGALSGMSLDMANYNL